MPNWCNNSIEIIGPADKIQALWAAAQAEESGLLNAMVPMPEGLRNTVKGSGDELQTETHDGFTNWYDWAVARWGTKWDVDIENLYYEDLGDGQAQIRGSFESAWGPPTEACETYAKANADVKMQLKYFEPGMSFMGVWDNEGGDTYYDDVGDMLEITEEEDAVVYELLEHFDVWSWYETDEEAEAEE